MQIISPLITPASAAAVNSRSCTVANDVGTRFTSVTTTTTTTMRNNGLVLLASDMFRGGDHMFALKASSVSSVALDMSRVRMRLEGLQAYATLCALLVNAALRLYSSVPDDASEDENQDSNEASSTADQKPRRPGLLLWLRRRLNKRLVRDIFFINVVLSVLSGSYVTIVFSLLALFSKTALSRNLDEEFLNFFRSTADLRESGFQSFLVTLMTFEVSFILSLFLKINGNKGDKRQTRRRTLLVLMAVFLSAWSISQWTTILHLAEEHLFTLHAEADFF